LSLLNAEKDVLLDLIALTFDFAPAFDLAFFGGIG
jgi:hypothetical protein